MDTLKIVAFVAVFGAGIAFHAFILDKPEVVNNYITEVKKLKQKGGEGNTATIDVEFDIKENSKSSKQK